MKKLFILLVFVMMWSCDNRIPNPDNPNTVGIFTQSIEQGYLAGSVGPDYIIEAKWKGKNLESVIYDCFEYSTSKDIPDEEIYNSLTKSLLSSKMEMLNEGSYVYEHFEIEPGKIFEVIAVATDLNGNAIVCRDTMSLKTVVIENSFIQELSLASSVEDAQENTRNTILASYGGC